MHRTSTIQQERRAASNARRAQARSKVGDKVTKLKLKGPQRPAGETKMTQLLPLLERGVWNEIKCLLSVEKAHLGPTRKRNAV